jgi:hypothetical protein
MSNWLTGLVVEDLESAAHILIICMPIGREGQ